MCFRRWGDAPPLMNRPPNVVGLHDRDHSGALLPPRRGRCCSPLSRGSHFTVGQPRIGNRKSELHRGSLPPRGVDLKGECKSDAFSSRGPTTRSEPSHGGASPTTSSHDPSCQRRSRDRRRPRREQGVPAAAASRLVRAFVQGHHGLAPMATHPAVAASQLRPGDSLK
jgi:hypothetical protein